MPTVFPWRVKKFFSKKTPVLYYMVNNFLSRNNVATDWDQLLSDSWDDVGRTWPNRARGIQDITGKDEKILDVGCGTGSILRTLLDQGYKNLFGLEQSGVSVERLDKLGINMRRGILPAIDFDDNFLDVLIASEVLEHILFQNRFLREIIRVLKPGDKALIYVPNDCMGPIDEPSHVRTYTKESLEVLLGQFGEVRSVEVVSEEHFEASFLFCLLIKRA